jgi:hypothetical protein
MEEGQEEEKMKTMRREEVGRGGDFTQHVDGTFFFMRQGGLSSPSVLVPWRWHWRWEKGGGAMERRVE